MSTDAIVVACGKTGDPRFSSLAPGGCKSMIRVNGRAAVHHLVYGLKRCEAVSRVILATDGGVPPEAQDDADSLPDLYIDGFDGEESAVLAGIRAASEADRCIVMSGDMPLVSAESLSDLFDSAPEAGVIYPIAPAAEAEAAFPGRKWSSLRTKEGDYTGSSCLLFRPESVLSREDMVIGLMRARKDPGAILKLIGPLMGLKMALSKPSLVELQYVLSEALGIDCRVFVTHYPELLFSIDSPEDVRIAEAALA